MFDAVAKAAAALLFQTYTYFPLLALALGRLNLYAQSYIFLLSNMSTMGPQGWVELVGLMTFWCWFTALCRTLQTPSDVFMFMFILTSHCTSFPPSCTSRSTPAIGAWTAASWTARSTLLPRR